MPILFLSTSAILSPYNITWMFVGVSCCSHYAPESIVIEIFVMSSATLLKLVNSEFSLTKMHMM